MATTIKTRSTRAILAASRVVESAYLSNEVAIDMDAGTIVVSDSDAASALWAGLMERLGYLTSIECCRTRSTAQESQAIGALLDKLDKLA